MYINKQNAMKKTLLLSSVILFCMGKISAQTAVDFTVNDCASTSHTLFTELNAGKVVVMTWVMPCGACIGIAGTASSKVKSYSSTNPGRVKFYLVDDYGDSPCNTINSWANTNSITTDAVFSNSAIKMTDYGSAGMQKTVVLGGTNHTVFYNVVGTVSSSALATAINNALAATTAVTENNNFNMGLNIYPNPVTNNTKVYYTLTKAANVNLEMINVLGEKISTVSLGTQSAGKQEYPINIEFLTEGVYFIKLNAEETSQTVKFTVVH